MPRTSNPRRTLWVEQRSGDRGPVYVVLKAKNTTEVQVDQQLSKSEVDSHVRAGTDVVISRGPVQ